MDPFRIEGPAVISFSGGRTSAYMLRRILDAHDGRLPCDVHVCFENTGKEREETLWFVEKCSRAWSVPVTWLERAPGGGHCVVDFKSASRNGEPFDQILRERATSECPLPGFGARFCSVELKTLTERSWALSVGLTEWTKVLGIRADEPKRVVKYHNHHEKEWDYRLPLADAMVTKAHVMLFWRSQQFDLGLKSFEGNCDLCFLKGKKKLERIIRDRPGVADWWAAHEARTGKTFRLDRPSTQKIRSAVLAQPEMFSGPLDGDDDFACTECGGDDVDVCEPTTEAQPRYEVMCPTRGCLRDPFFAHECDAQKGGAA